jgi:uncharacterized integral membrane protein
MTCTSLSCSLSVPFKLLHAFYLLVFVEEQILMLLYFAIRSTVLTVLLIIFLNNNKKIIDFYYFVDDDAFCGIICLLVRENHDVCSICMFCVKRSYPHGAGH